MASQMVIPASNDTLFMRGFSSRHHVEDIRDFFQREGGRNTVEFFKENNMGDGLYIALKFESKSIAKDILNRFDGYEVLGDRVSISWYKDIRKAQRYNDSAPPFRPRPPNPQWGQDRYNDYRGPGGYNRGRPGPYNRGSGPRQGGWYPRGEYSGDGGSRTRRFTRSSSHSRSRSGTPRSRSRSYTRSSSRDDSRSRSIESRERTRKRQRSMSGSSRRRSTGRKGKGRDLSSASRSPELDDLGSHSDSDSVTPPPRPEKPAKKTKAAKKDIAAVGSEAAVSNVAKAKDAANTTGEFEESDVNEFSIEGLTSPPQPVPPPANAPAPTGKAARAVRSAVSTVDKPVGMGKRQKNTAIEDAIEAANVPQSEITLQNAGAKKAEMAGKVKKTKADRRMYEDPISDDDDAVAEKAQAPGGHKPEERFKRLSKDTLAAADTSNNIFDEPPTKRKVATVPKKANIQKEFDPFDNEDEDEEAEQQVGVKGRNRRVGDADDSTLRATIEKSRRAAAAAVTSGLSASTKRTATGGRDGGVLGLSHEKMLLVRQKKDEIEKAYRQDCETFATVTKMLINKEPSLEDKIQDSLRENLKEIGQRCIQELREFIDRLREEDEPDSSI